MGISRGGFGDLIAVFSLSGQFPVLKLKSFKVAKFQGCKVEMTISAGILELFCDNQRKNKTDKVVSSYLCSSVIINRENQPDTGWSVGK